MKTVMREKILQKRNQLTQKELQEKSKIICGKLLSLESYKKSSTIFCFLSFGSEVDTWEIIKDALSKSKKVYVPYIDPKESRMHAVQINHSSTLIKNKFGIPEPVYDPSVPDPLDFDFAVVPGVAFDKNGFRIGYGKGYYDRFFQNCPVSCKTGIAFALQVVSSVPGEEHDIPVDIVITEEDLISVK